MTTSIPSACALNSAGRAFLLSWLEVDLVLGKTVTPESWRAAYGRAADYQTVAAARAELAGVSA